MSAKLKSLKDGTLTGIAAEKTKATLVDHFVLAEKAITPHPRGLPGQSAPTPAFSTESAAATNAPECRVTRVPLERLQENSLNARRIYDPQITQEWAASIATYGQQTPGLAAPDPARPGWHVLIDDHYRKRALTVAGEPEMDRFVEDGPPDIDLYRLSFVLNEQRSGQSVLDNVIAWRRPLDEGKAKKEEDICEITGISTGTVNKALALLKLPESVLEVMEERPAGAGIAAGYELTLCFKAAGKDRTRELVYRVLEEGLSSRDVEQIRKVVQEGHTRKAKEMSRQYEIRSAEGDLFGTVKEWDSGRVMLGAKFVDHGVRELLVEALKSRSGLDIVLLQCCCTFDISAREGAFLLVRFLCVERRHLA